MDLFEAVGWSEDIMTVDLREAFQKQDIASLRDAQGATLLHVCAKWNYPRLAATLVKEGVPINARDNGGFMCMHEAARYNNVAVGLVLIDLGARAGARTWITQESPYDVARAHGHSGFCEMLASIGSPPAS